MNQTDKLFYLVHSLTPTEKRFFALFSRRHSGNGASRKRNKYYILFHILNSLQAYDETVVHKKLTAKKVRSHLPSLKVELYTLLLRAMREFRSGKDASIQLRELLDDALFLMEKGLYGQCMDILKKAKGLAALHEEQWAIMRIYDLERTLAYNTTTRHLRDTVEAINQSKTDVLQEVATLHTMQGLYDAIFVQVRVNPHTPSSEDLDRLHRTMEHPLLSASEELLSFNTQCYFYNTHAQYCQINGDLHSALVYQKQLVELWEQPVPDKKVHNYSRIKDNPQRYLKVLSNLAGLCLRLGDMGTVQATIYKLEHIQTRTFDDEAEQFQNIVHLRLLYIINTGKFDGIVELLPSIHAGMAKYEKKINPARRLALYYNLAILLFCIERFSEALFWIDKIISDRKARIRVDILACAHLLRSVVHYELGDDDFIDNLISSTDRYLQSVEQEHLQLLERELLRFLRRLPAVTGAQKRRALCRAMQSTIDELVQNGTAGLGFRELSCWLESRITLRPLADVCKERIKKTTAK